MQREIDVDLVFSNLMSRMLRRDTATRLSSSERPSDAVGLCLGSRSIRASIKRRRCSKFLALCCCFEVQTPDSCKREHVLTFRPFSTTTAPIQKTSSANPSIGTLRASSGA